MRMEPPFPIMVGGFHAPDQGSRHVGARSFSNLRMVQRRSVWPKTSPTPGPSLPHLCPVPIGGELVYARDYL